MTAHSLGNRTRDHNNLTAPRVLCTTHCSNSDANNKKKNLLMTMYDGKYDVMISMSEHLQ
jgi:hypothetical protein